jgi:hypothetical protein
MPVQLEIRSRSGSGALLADDDLAERFGREQARNTRKVQG